MEDYLIDDLQINGYPTHIVVNKNGLVVKVIENNITELINVIEEEANK